MSETSKRCCESCEHYEQDDDGTFNCEMSLDEDEMCLFIQKKTRSCPYYKFYDEYKSVQKQN